MVPIIKLSFCFKATEKVMTEFHNNRIQECYTDLVDNMEVAGVVNHFISAHLFTLRNADDIRQPTGKAQQVETLLNIVLCKPDIAYSKLVEALKATRQGHLAKLLLRKGRVLWIIGLAHITACLQ